MFVTSGTENGIQQRLAEFVGVNADATPTIRLLQPGDEMKKFVYPGELATVSVHTIKNFVNDFTSGNLRPHLKSEPIPDNSGALTTLVGLNYDQIVNDSTKDVLVKFYAPWCGHCKSLAPIWDELAEATVEIKDLVIAKFDATANEVDGVNIRGYPTLRFYPKDNKAGVEYEGDRDLQAFKSYLNTHSSAYKQHMSAQHDEL